MSPETSATSDEAWMRRAIELSRLCPPSQTAFSVGAVIVDAEGHEIASGCSRETDEHVHAEESALAKLASDDLRLSSATIYSTLEPCAKRKSRPLTCTQLVLRAGVPRVVIAWREPDLFVRDVDGVELLREAGGGRRGAGGGRGEAGGGRREAGGGRREAGGGRREWA